ncbi:DUF6157 family protein [Cytophagaceae bacterium YF14B1]|uniref:DUF6157 family protein n=1 Tax=Xanthocytophaga flava TaxID=3048013 RepID=A0AAE3QRQ1_9BACT|nr:DUF6157 family protein [Xanthocytophaga flavus]MDJ1481961.1 DUF6157 family protein [Xanthocytophaga flavus]
MSKDKIHTTNYFDTFIEVAEDTKVSCGTIPKSKGDNKTVAELQYELLVNSPYTFTSDDLFFQLFANRNNLTEHEYEEARKNFFSKAQPCFRSSPFTKIYGYGFGVHSDSEGKVAIVGMETERYQKLQSDPKIKKLKAMRTTRR